MNSKTRKLTFASLMAALTVVFLYFACLMPVGLLGFIAIASLFIIAAVIESGRIYGTGSYAASAVIGFLIMPDKTAVIVFSLFFGIYPILKSLFEQTEKRVTEWILKLASFNILFTAIWLLAGKLIFSDRILSFPVPVIFICCNIVFVIYDIGLSKLIIFYINRISKKLKR